MTEVTISKNICFHFCNLKFLFLETYNTYTSTTVKWLNRSLSLRFAILSFVILFLRVQTDEIQIHLDTNLVKSKTIQFRIIPLPEISFQPPFRLR